MHVIQMIQVFCQVTHVQGHEGELTYDQQSFLQDTTLSQPKSCCEKHPACRLHAKFPSVFYGLYRTRINDSRLNN